MSGSFQQSSVLQALNGNYPEITVFKLEKLAVSPTRLCMWPNPCTCISYTYSYTAQCVDKNSRTTSYMRGLVIVCVQ